MNIKCIVKNIVWKTPTVIKISCRPEIRYKFKAGQYAFIKTHNMPEERAFSIASAENEDDIKFHVRKISDDSNSSFQKLSYLNKDDIISISDAQGNNAVDTTKNVALSLIAGGVGIAPMYSILKTVQYKQPKRKVTLYWGVNSQNDAYLNDEIHQLINKNTNFEAKIICKDKATAKNSGLITDYIENNLEQLQKQIIHIAGPKEMMRKTIELLEKQNIDNKNIFYDKFW